MSSRGLAHLWISESAGHHWGSAGHPSMLSVSGQRILTDDGFELMAGFLDIWMGQTPVSEDVRNQLLEGLR